MRAGDVPLCDHAALYAAAKPRIDAAISRVVTSRNLDWGEEVPAFEAAFAAWLGASHAVGFGSSTGALKAALKALGIGPGDEVITVTNTNIAGSSAIHFVGADIVWVDFDPTTRNVDVALAEAAITPRTRAIPWIQTSSATVDLKAAISSAMASAGVLHPRVFLGRLFIRFATSFSHVWLAPFRSVPLGMN